MRKRITGSAPASGSERPPLDLEEIATVEVTSEDPDFPIEAVFKSVDGSGWRALEAGDQHIRIIFDQPLPLKRIRLEFIENELERTQEITLHWSSAAGGSRRELLRQQWNFSPSGSIQEVEDLTVDLVSVSALELVIRPDIAKPALATLFSWRLY